MSKILGIGPAGRALRHADVGELYAPVSDEMDDVERLLRRELRSDFPYVNELIQHGCLLGGKRLRPALLLLVAKAIGPVRQEHTVLAAVVEMIHTATLIHDDVLDEAETRRHLATVNSRWDNKASVLLGDFLFTHAFYLASTLESTWACRQIGRATNIVCEGELRQKGTRGDFTLSEQEYLSIIAAKTAELCACSCRLGAHYALASDEIVDAMTRFGLELGIAFQIVDDVLDLFGDEQTTGKSLGTDLEQQKLTLPLIRALAAADRAQKEQILDIVNGPEPQRRECLTPVLEQFGALDYTRQQAEEHIRRAVQQLDCLPDSSIRSHLAELAEFVAARTR